VIVESPGSGGVFRFAHALLHETLYGGMAAMRRARLHARVADALEGRRGPVRVVELAHHLWRAAPSVPTDRVLRALFRAAEDSMGGLAYERGAELLGRALELLAATPPSEGRDRNELWAQVRLGMVRAATKGQGSPGAAASFARARELCAGDRHLAEELPVLYGLFLVSWHQVNLPATAAYAAQLLDVAKSTHDPSFLVAGHQASGLTAFQHGALETARHHFGQAVVTADSLADPSLADVMHGDPSVAGRSLVGFVDALSGQPSQASALAAEGLELARRSGHSWSIAVAMSMRTWVAVVLRQHERAEGYADEAAAFAAEAGFEDLATSISTMRGWAKAHRGDTAWGLELAEAGFGRAAFMMPFNLALLAEVEHLAGRAERALATVDRGLAEVACRGERFYEAELHRLRGDLLADLLSEQVPERAAEAETCLGRAVEVARGQGAHLLEARALDSLARLRERLPSAR